MTIKVTGTFLDNTNYTCTADSCSKISSAWQTKFKNNKFVPQILGVVYNGPLAVFYTNWSFGSGKRLPGSGGFTDAGTDRAFKISVTSDEFPHSVINNNYIVVLSKEEYHPNVVDENGFYLAKVFVNSNNRDQDLYFYMYTKRYESAPPLTYEFVKLCNIYDNTLYTIAVLGNMLCSINQQYSFSIDSVDKFTFYWSVSTNTDYIPLLYTIDNKYTNVFTSGYFTDDLYYFTENLQWWYSIFCQTVELKTPTTNSITMKNKTYFATSSDIKDITLTPPTSLANIPQELYNIKNIEKPIEKPVEQSENNIWLIVAIICVVIIIAIIIIKYFNKQNNNKQFRKIITTTK